MSVEQEIAAEVQVQPVKSTLGVFVPLSTLNELRGSVMRGDKSFALMVIEALLQLPRRLF